MKRVAVVGAGKWGSNWVRTLDDLGELAAVVEANPDLRRQWEEAYPCVNVTASVDDVLKSEIPAMVIATPAASHFDLASRALLAGKDVLVEKPFTLSVRDAEELAALAEQTGRVLLAGHLLLYQPAIQWIKRYVDSGELGRLHSIHQTRAQHGRIRSVENVWWSLGVHDVAALLYLIGESPARLAGIGHRMLQEEIEDEVFVHMVFPSGVQAHLRASWLWPTQERRLVIIGSRGMLEFDESKQRVVLHRKTVDAGLACRDGGSEVVFEETQKPLKNQALHFLACVERRELPLADARSGVEVIRVLEEAARLWKERECR